MESLVQDVRYGLRALRKSPGFTAVAALALALGIGANAVLFSVISFALLRPLPYAEPSRLLLLNENSKNFPAMSVSWPDYLDWKEQGGALFTHFGALRGDGFNLVGGGDPERLTGIMATAGVLPALGVKPVLGRLYAADEDRPGAPRTVVLTGGLWKRRFASDPGIVGRSIDLGGDSYTVIGVLPGDFYFPVPADLFVPLGLFGDRYPDRGSHPGIYVVGRMKPGVTLEQVRKGFDAIAARIGEAYPRHRGTGVTVQPLREFQVAAARPALIILWGAVTFVLLIAAANVANLLLARAAARQGEIAVRIALGAGRGRIVRQLLTESVLLALLGGGLGLLLASFGLDALSPLLQSLPRGKDVHLDGLSLAFTAAVSLVTGVGFGLYPALRASAPDVHALLKEARPAGSHHRLGGALVAAEVALSMVLLIGAGLLLRSFSRLSSVNPGFDASRVITLRISLPRTRYPTPESMLRFVDEVRRRAAAVPGVESAALAGGMPLIGTLETSVQFEGQEVPDHANPAMADVYPVTPGYLEAMRIPILEGRAFQEADAGRRVAIIDDAMARRFFPGQSPIGRRFSGDKGKPGAEIIGVAGHVQNYALDGSGPVHMGFYLPLSNAALMAPGSSYELGLVARGAVDAASLGEPLRKAVLEVDPLQPVFAVRTLESVVEGSLGARRLSLLLLGVFAAVALLLASVGIYGVMSYSVERRTREIGIRMALGAERGAVLRLVVGQGARMALAGIAAGMAGALALSRVMARLLYGISATDPVTYAALGLFLCGIAMLASWLPARRAVRVDPAVALRAE